MELCLGTVQFGLDYGVVNGRQVPLGKAVECLGYAVTHGISSIDTAAAYGNAEEVVGTFLAESPVARDKLSICTKLLPNCLDGVEDGDLKDHIVDGIKGSLDHLGTDYIDHYLLHSSRYAFRGEVLEALQEVKRMGLARKIGVSVYDPDEALACFKSGLIDVIQLPFSVLDHRAQESGVFEAAVEAGCEVHIRSAFVKGLALMDDDCIPDHLDGAKPIVKKFAQISSESGYSRVDLAIAYVRRATSASRLVVGVHSLAQLKDDIRAFGCDVPKTVLDYMDSEFEGLPAEIVIPSLWKK